MVANLRAIGATVHEVDPNTGRQFRYLTHGGHFGGSMDGAVLGIPEAPKTWHLFEGKTHNQKSFRALEKKGVKEAKPEHWHQMQTYMGLSGLRRALYFAVCKDTDAIYIERVQYEAAAYERTLKKALRVIQTPEPLSRIADDADYFACKWCDFKKPCHEGRMADVHCRTCLHATPVTEGEGGRWRCERHDREIDTRDQLRGCDDHLFIPALIPHAEPTDAGDDWVRYQMRDRDQAFVNCGATGFPAQDAPTFSSTDLKAVPPEAIGNEIVEEARSIFGGALAPAVGE